VDTATLLKAMPGLDPQRADELIDGANDCLRRCNCTTVDRAAMLLAQVGEESASLRFPTELASGDEYEGRTDLGNTHPGDGVRFKGRGFIQVTGRANYGELSKWAHKNGLCAAPTHFVDHPDELASDRHVWTGVVWYWTVARDMNPLADARDIDRATRAINGGLHGLDDRTSRWHRCLALGEAILPTGIDWFEMATREDLQGVVRDEVRRMGDAPVTATDTKVTMRLGDRVIDMGRKINNLKSEVESIARTLTAMEGTVAAIKKHFGT
jgi:predicted chitinase